MQEITNPNTIPPITHPLGKHWDQPNMASMCLFPGHVIMTEVVLKQLPEYSATIPTGVYSGKMWRAKCKGGFMLVWYGTEEKNAKQEDVCPICCCHILVRPKAWCDKEWLRGFKI